MAHIHLHIGLNKTGTSSIQDFFQLNAEALRARGWCYPETGRADAAHHPLSTWLRSAAGQQARPEAPLLAALRAEIADARDVVISSEDFHTHGPRSIAHLAEVFRGHRVQVLLYVREQLAYLASWYQQNIQASHQAAPFDIFCFLQRKPLAALAQQWVEVFGAGQVQVRLYDRAHLVGGDVVTDLAEAIGLGRDLSAFRRKPYESNPSISGNLLFAKRVLNTFLDKAQGAALVDELTGLSLLRESFRGAMRVPEAQAEVVRQSYRQDRLQLRKRFGLEIEPGTGDHPGHACPDLAILRDDWALLVETSRARGGRFGALAGMLQLGDLSVLQAA